MNESEVVLKKQLRREIHPGPVNLWPEISAEISKIPVHSGYKRWTLVPIAVMLMAMLLMGAGFLHHWYVIQKDGTVLKLSENEPYDPGEGYTMIQPDLSEVPESYAFDYDWIHDECFIPGIMFVDVKDPELREALIAAPIGTLLEIQDGKNVVSGVKGGLTTDYETFRNIDNELQISFPEANDIPAAYSQHQRFMSSYYLTEKELQELRESGEITAGNYTIYSYDLPNKVHSQIGWTCAQWFTEDKKPLTMLTRLTDSTDVLITSTDADFEFEDLHIEGMEKAICYESYNEAFQDREMNLIMWKKIDPMLVVDREAYCMVSGLQTRRVEYLEYTIQTVGLSKKEVQQLAYDWISAR